MKRVPLVLFSVLMLAVLSISLMGSASVAAKAPEQPTVTAGTPIAAPETTAAGRPWTREEMLAAKPYPMPELSGSPRQTTLAADPEIGSGAFPSMSPDAAVETLAVADTADYASPLGYTYPAPFTRYQNFDGYTVFPYKTVGKLFFTQNGGNYVCSASSIGNYAIWTAGHCVHDGNGSSSGWSYNVVFVPAYKNGAAPYGQWTVPSGHVWTLTGWYSNGDLRYDHGAAVLSLKNGYKISQKVGNLGFAYNIGANKAWFSMGYPAAAPFNGMYQNICAASFAYLDGNFATPKPVGIGCDMTGGCSGGPWIYKFSGSAGATNYLNGNNSYRYVNPNHPLEMFSPYFTTGAKNLYDLIIVATP